MPRKTRPILALSVALGLGVPMIVAGIAVWLMLMLPAKSETRHRPNTPPAATATLPKVWTADELEAAVLGKTPDEVLATLGRPDRTTNTDQHWSYDSILLNRITNKLTTVIILFSDGKVVEVYR